MVQLHPDGTGAIGGTAQVVPEPGSLVLMSLGLAGLLWRRRVAVLSGPLAPRS